jgi:aspartate--ammonia ligase
MILPRDYDSLLTPKETMRALFGVKNYIQENLCKELNLMMIQVPLIVDREIGVTIWPKELRDICAERNIHVLH